MKPVLSRKFSFAPGFGQEDSEELEQNRKQPRSMDPVSKSKSLDICNNGQLMDFDEELAMILKQVEEKRANHEIKRPVPVRPEAVSGILSKSNSLDNHGRLIRRPVPMRSNSTIVHLESEEDSNSSSPFQQVHSKHGSPLSGLHQFRRPTALRSNSALVPTESNEEPSNTSGAKARPVLIRADAHTMENDQAIRMDLSNMVSDGPSKVIKGNELLSKRLSLDPSESESRPEFVKEIREIVKEQVESEKRDILTPIPRLTKSLEGRRSSLTNNSMSSSGDKTLKVIGIFE